MYHFLRKPATFAGQAMVLLLVLAVLQPTAAAADIPPTWSIVTDNFEDGLSDEWRTISPSDLSLVAGGGNNSSTGLAVSVGQHQSYIYRRDVARAEEGYLTFWFDPNSVSIPDEGTSWIPSKSIRIGAIMGSEAWGVLVGLRVRRPQGDGYRAYLEWDAQDGRQYDLGAGEFALSDGWQKITLGFGVDDWVSVWLNDIQVREITGVSHNEDLGELFQIGKASSNSVMTPSGTLRFDDVAFQVPKIADLWVDAVDGDDSSDGLTANTAFRTIQAAATFARPGTTVRILPGVYRETVWPFMGGGVGEPVVYRSENGPGTAIIRGSEPASSLNWTRLTSNSIGLPSDVDPANIYYADLSSWSLASQPRFVVELDSDGNISARLPMAREPDWDVETDWKYSEYWWSADGGSNVANCDPTTDADRDCDYPSRSLGQLTDLTNDTDPNGVEPGNLSTLGNLTGATLVAMDTRQGHYTYWRTIVSHNVSAGRITVDEICEHVSGSGEPGLGWGSKYFLEGKPNLLDSPGEWWYDATNQRLYLWPPSPGSPDSQNLEISRRDTGFDLSRLSYTTLDGLTLELFNNIAIFQMNQEEHRSYSNTVRDVTVQYANEGVVLSQNTGPVATNVTHGFTLHDSEIARMDTLAIRLDPNWPGRPSPNQFTHSGMVDTVIQNNSMHHLGFRSDRDNAVGAVFPYADKIRFEGNHVHHVAQNGVQFNKSIIQSAKTYDFDQDEIKTGEILIKDNLFEQACQLAADCGALKIWGEPPDHHIFRDLLITGNTFRNTIGWTDSAEKRGRWSGGPSSDVQGMGGSGLYIDMCSGIHAYRNVAYNNANTGFAFGGVWREGDITFYNNIAANSLRGFRLDGAYHDTHGGSMNTQLFNNIVANNEGYGILVTDNDGIFGTLSIDHNLYYNNGWRPYESGGLPYAGSMAIYLDNASNQFYETLAEIQASTPWEDHGRAGDPRFQDYDVGDHSLFDGSWPDFHLTAQSTNAIDRGTSSLPASLTALLSHFGLDQSYQGAAYDTGQYEYGSGGFVKTADTLLVADNDFGSSNPYASYYTTALDSLAHAHDVWDTGIRGAPDGSILGQYADGVVIWAIPGAAGYLQDANVQSGIQTFLDAGGKLLISGQDVGYVTRGTALLNDYLHATYVQNSSGILNLQGTGGDPIGDGLVLSLQGGSGADNQSSPDEIEPHGPTWSAFSYDSGTPASPAGLRINTGTYRVVYLPFGFEGIASASNRIAVMQRALEWLSGTSTVVQVALTPGWNLSSWPVEPLMADVSGTLQTISDRTCRVIGEQGVYDCSVDPVYQSLTELHSGQAYYVQVSGSTPADLWVEGAAVPPSTPLPLHKFWNWTGYLPSTALPIATALESIDGKYLIVHSIDKTYNPAEPLYSTLTQMEPGQGYLIRATEAVDLIYPSSTASAPEESQQESPEACDAAFSTPHFAVVYGEIEVGAAPAPAGTVVEVVDPAGVVAGCSVVRQPGHYGYMHVYGRGEATQAGPGLQPGDAYTFRVNGIPTKTPVDLKWASDPAPLEVRLDVVRNPAYLPCIQQVP